MLAPGISSLLESKGPFCQNYFETGKEGINYLINSKILIIGAGGLGCELLKSLSLTGFRNIHIVDMDTVDVSNLNRQFLFRESDIGKPKSICAAEFIKRRIPNINVTPHFCKIQEFDDDFYKQFDLIIAGLDSIKARLWISDNLCRISRESYGEYSIPFIDGGSEGWKGHIKLITPLESACMRCQLDLFPPPVVFQSCTIASNPRQPEHCILWAKEHQWPLEKPNEALDGDNNSHIEWIVDQAKQHAKRFGLPTEDITFKLAKGVIKNIIPAIASTQAIVASICATEAFKLITGVAPTLDNNILFVGDAFTGVNWTNFKYEKKEDCEECSVKLTKVQIVENETVQQLIDRIGKEFNYNVSSLRTATKTIYMPIISATKENLSKPISDFVEENEVIVATSRTAPEAFEFMLCK
ncbi:ubiquitin-activating enzyme E1 C [Histomonas meleagridis]|uniref:ubiquitin-activating enzyme E1 C n=1 Tax=Histomonas meleagridis TaxID=135588 RepID=UPI00355A47AC|nr:ubiquitin-activating enzyme E1 C [Histomonas meleagridis]KAH0804310.1 ubiquitin-activating enzyme E1 C [Histomonas meleagridis]